jgi:hypothetical protein
MNKKETKIVIGTAIAIITILVLQQLPTNIRLQLSATVPPPNVQAVASVTIIAPPITIQPPTRRRIPVEDNSINAESSPTSTTQASVTTQEAQPEPEPEPEPEIEIQSSAVEEDFLTEAAPEEIIVLLETADLENIPTQPLLSQINNNNVQDNSRILEALRGQDEIPASAAESISIVETGPIELSGTVTELPPFSIVVAEINSTPVETLTTTTDAKGNWQIKTSANISEGFHVITIKAVDANDPSKAVKSVPQIVYVSDEPEEISSAVELFSQVNRSILQEKAQVLAYGELKETETEEELGTVEKLKGANPQLAIYAFPLKSMETLEDGAQAITKLLIQASNIPAPFPMKIEGFYINPQQKTFQVVNILHEYEKDSFLDIPFLINDTTQQGKYSIIFKTQVEDLFATTSISFFLLAVENEEEANKITREGRLRKLRIEKLQAKEEDELEKLWEEYQKLPSVIIKPPTDLKKAAQTPKKQTAKESTIEWPLPEISAFLKNIPLQQSIETLLTLLQTVPITSSTLQDFSKLLPSGIIMNGKTIKHPNSIINIEIIGKNRYFHSSKSNTNGEWLTKVPFSMAEGFSLVTLSSQNATTKDLLYSSSPQLFYFSQFAESHTWQDILTPQEIKNLKKLILSESDSKILLQSALQHPDKKISPNQSIFVNLDIESAEVPNNTNLSIQTEITTPNIGTLRMEPFTITLNTSSAIEVPLKLSKETVQGEYKVTFKTSFENIYSSTTTVFTVGNKRREQKISKTTTEIEKKEIPTIKSLSNKEKGIVLTMLCILASILVIKRNRKKTNRNT